MENKKQSAPVSADAKDEVVMDFGEFGQLTKVNIQDLFVDIHATVSPLDPLSKQAAEEAAC